MLGSKTVDFPRHLNTSTNCIVLHCQKRLYLATTPKAASRIATSKCMQSWQRLTDANTDRYCSILNVQKPTVLPVPVSKTTFWKPRVSVKRRGSMLSAIRSVTPAVSPYYYSSQLAPDLEEGEALIMTNAPTYRFDSQTNDIFQLFRTKTDR